MFSSGLSSVFLATCALASLLLAHVNPMCTDRDQSKAFDLNCNHNTVNPITV